MTLHSINFISRRRLVLAAAALAAPAFARSPGRPSEVDTLLAVTCGPLARTHDIPGLVVGLLFEGRPYFLTLGSTALQGGSAVTPDTLFELGSISKCFTSLLAGLAQVRGRMGLEQPVGEVVQALRGTPIGQATPLHLATYTAGGLPLQFPDGVNTSDQAIAWLASFEPDAAPGTVRRYSNPSIGLLGHAAATGMGKDFTELSEHMLASLGLGSTFITVPRAQMHRYAWGHDKNQRQVRVNPGAFDAQAYGIKSSASDMLRFLQAVLDPDRMPPAIRQALAVTTTPRYQIGPMQQGMGWEMYAPPWSLPDLQQGNGPITVLQPQPAKALLRSATPTVSLLLNKTGSTSGFGAYVALVPQRQVAFVILANRNFPVADRVSVAHQVLQALGV
jgi:beta-lactamase class C